MPLPKTLSEAKKQGWTGPDIDLETSLFEYGIAWKPYRGKDRRRGEYLFLYGVDMGMGPRGEEEYTHFDWSTITRKEFADMLSEDWFNLRGFLSYTGFSSAGEAVEYFPDSVYFAANFHGYDNIFGPSYSAVRITYRP